MKKFRKTIITPLQDTQSMNLKIAEVKEIDLTHLSPEESEAKMIQVYNLLKKFNEAIIAEGDNRDSMYISSVIK